MVFTWFGLAKAFPFDGLMVYFRSSFGRFDIKINFILLGYLFGSHHLYFNFRLDRLTCLCGLYDRLTKPARQEIFQPALVLSPQFHLCLAGTHRFGWYFALFSAAPAFLGHPAFLYFCRLRRY